MRRAAGSADAVFGDTNAAPGRLTAPSRFLGLATGRGLALFFGLFSLANAVMVLRAAAHTEDLWWIDLRFLPPGAALGFSVVAAALLLAWGMAPIAAAWRRWLTAAACVALAAAAVRNVVAFYQVWQAGGMAPGVPVPSSAIVAAAFAGVCWAVLGAREPAGRRANDAATAVVVAAAIVAFPLMQMAFFGTTDYRQRADAAVVLGAKVDPGGALSTALEDRVRTGAQLYKAGLVSKLVMSGATGASGLDEPVSMTKRAVQLGVPYSAILLDHKGVNTDATVRETTAIFRREGIHSVLAVSQFWHLPRIKLAYRAAGWDVRTVPAGASIPIAQTPLLIAREIPAFWEYWARVLARDVVRGG